MHLPQERIMYKQLMELSKKVEEVKKEFRRALLRSLGVDRLVKRAFEEGWQMAHDTDHNLVQKVVVCPKGYVDDLMKKTRCWRSVDEAFANSDVEEEV
jgi:uncharacterized ferritin-like protein (DUF455 family)